MITTNYLDDFLFLVPSQITCNQMVRRFLDLCAQINVPVALDKTEWASKEIIFLGIGLNGEKLILQVPEEKKVHVLNWINYLLDRKKCKVKELEQFTGLLNFIAKAIVPGRAFTRRMYAKFTGLQKVGLKSHHHIRLDKEFQSDCEM